MLIVIIDDEESVRTGLRRLCVSLGLRASVYASGSEFLDSLAAGAAPPDCLLLDAHMPHMSGLEVQRHLVDAGLNVPTIVYTADDAPEAEARYASISVDTLCSKRRLLRRAQRGPTLNESCASTTSSADWVSGT